MYPFQVDRTQFPIGQGGFHSTVVHDLWRMNRVMSMVVDCGGSNKDHRKLLINAFAESQREHDILAISHLDEDHINGIDELKDAGVIFRAVFLPHLGKIEDYLLWMVLRLSARSDEVNVQGREAEIARVVCTVLGLYGGFYGSVVLVGAGKDNQKQEGDAKIPPEPFGWLVDKARKALQEAAGKPGKFFPHSQSLIFKQLDWLFRFYSLEWKWPTEAKINWDSELLRPLKDIISDGMQVPLDDSVFGKPLLDNSVFGKFAGKLSNQLASKVVFTGDAKEAVEAALGKDAEALANKISNEDITYKGLLSKLYELSESLDDYNDASMCVYSGPAQRGTGGRSWFSRYSSLTGKVRAEREQDGFCSRNVGWISTGDADFKADKLKLLLEHYHAEMPLTSVFVLPHHGSKGSYDPNMDQLRELISHLCDRPLLIAPADPTHKKYQHPHWPVESTCRKAGDFLIVSEDFASRYDESVGAAMPHEWCFPRRRR